MDVKMFGNSSPGTLVPIVGTDPTRGTWRHYAFVPDPLPPTLDLSSLTHIQVAEARAALSKLDVTASRLQYPSMLRRPALRREAQSTSALEGTYAPLSDVLKAGEDDPQSPNIREILNYVDMAEHAFAAIAEGRPLSAGLLCELQLMLVRRTPTETGSSGQIRDVQVVIGRNAAARATDLPVHAARFVPPPEGHDLEARVRDLVDWMRADHLGELDPVVAAAMAHYQFEALHPFHDGNGRIGRLLVVLQLLAAGVLTEPTLTVSPWFEERRSEYYDRLLAVSTKGDWDAWVEFFVVGIRESALSTYRQMETLLEVQDELKDRVRSSNLRADSAHALVELAIANPSFTVRTVEHELGVSYGRANVLVRQLVSLGVLDTVNRAGRYNRRFYAPRVIQAMLDAR